MVTAMCGAELKGKKISMDIMLIIGLNVKVDQLAMANSVTWHGNVLRREDGHVLRRVLGLEAEGQKMKGRPKVKG